MDGKRYHFVCNLISLMYPELEFIEFCKREPDERLGLLPEILLIQRLEIPKENINKLNYILDFLGWWAEDYHSLKTVYPDKKDEEISFFGLILHYYLSDDLKTILLLLLTNQHHQANVILRRVIEYVIYSICLDILSRFGTAKYNTFEMYWDAKEWKKLLRNQRISEKDMRNKIDEIYELNQNNNENKEEFRDRFFHEGNELDFWMLMQKFICKNCLAKKDFIYDEIEFNEIPDSDEDIIEPHFSWGENIPKCEYCKKHDASDFVFHALPLDTIFVILKKFLSDNSMNSLSNLDKIYSILSNYFVHFSTNIFPSDESAFFDINRKEINLWGSEGVVYMLENLSIVLCDYFVLLKSKHKINDDVEHCKIRKRGFSSFIE